MVNIWPACLLSVVHANVDCTIAATGMGNLYIFDVPDQVCCDALSAITMGGMARTDLSAYGGWATVGGMVGITECHLTPELISTVNGISCSADAENPVDPPTVANYASLGLINAYVCGRWTEGCQSTCFEATGAVASAGAMLESGAMWTSLGCAGSLPESVGLCPADTTTTTTMITTTTMASGPGPGPASPSPTPTNEDSDSHATGASLFPIIGLLVAQFLR